MYDGRTLIVSLGPASVTMRTMRHMAARGLPAEATAAQTRNLLCNKLLLAGHPEGL